MRSRALQPRSLFRIATSSSTVVPATSTGLAAIGTRQSSHVPPSRSLSRTRSRTRSNSSSNSTAATAPLPTSTALNNTNTPTTSRPTSSNTYHTHPYHLSHPLIPVRPPPHSQSSIGLQAFFSQGRPLLEYHNMLEGSDGVGLIPAQSPATFSLMGALPIPLPSEEPDVKAEVSSDEVGDESSGAMTTSPHSTDGSLLRNHELPPAIHADIKAKVHALFEKLASLKTQMMKASPAQRRNLLANFAGSVKHLAPPNLEHGQESLPIVPPAAITFQLHLPALQSIPPEAFDKVIQALTSHSSDASNPLSLYTQIFTMQRFESDRQLSMRQALERGENTELASALGPESDLVVLGEPEGPRKEWGRGVASYLARNGRPFCPPPAPIKGEEAAKVKKLDDLMSYHVNVGEDEAESQCEFVELESDPDTPEGSTSLSERIAEHFSSSSSSSPSSYTHSGGTSTADAEDVDLWLGHALVQERLQTQLQWDRLVSMMGSSSLGSSPPHVDVSKLHISLPSRPRSSRSRSIPPHPLVAFLRAGLEERREADERRRAEKENEQGENIVSLDSVKRKRKKKMNKMKYKKLRKRRRAERLRLGK